jgi:hypothetical protein
LTVEQFIHRYLESVDHLRAVLLLCGSPRTEWDATDVGTRLYLTPALAAAVLARLEANGLVASNGEPRRYRYQAQSPELASLVEQIVVLDREHPVSLIQMIYARPKDIQAFADAFRLRREKEN